MCVHPSNFTFENCNFSDNDGSLLWLSNYALDCKTNIFFNKSVNVTKNKSDFLMYFYSFSVYMNGVITVLENILTLHIIDFHQCGVTFTKTITFVSNICSIAIQFISHELPYMVIMEYSNITFINNTIHYQVIDFEALVNNTFPYCIFQYNVSMNDKHNVSELIRLYTISFSDNKPQNKHPPIILPSK